MSKLLGQADHRRLALAQWYPELGESHCALVCD